MSRIADILAHNRTFVQSRAYEAYRTDRFPEKGLVVITCMDTRLVELLPRAMGVRNGDVTVVKTAGAVVAHPFGSAMRSVIVAVYELGAAEVAVVGHHDCGMTGLSCARILDKAIDRGTPRERIDTVAHSGVDLAKWLAGFETPADGVRASVAVVRHHPLLPADVPVHGLLMDPETGALEVLVDGYGRRNEG